MYFLLSRRGLSLQEAIDMAYSDQVEAIYIEPPDSNVLTDEDSGDEDAGGSMENLSGAQLRAPAEVRLLNTDNIATPSTSTTKTTEKTKQTFEWIEGDLESQKKDFPDPDFTIYQELTPIELLELFFDDDLISFLIEETSRYALYKNMLDPKVSKNEMKVFLAILIVSGYVVLPGKRYYWESQGDMRNNLISDSMRRDRFFQIMRFIHCADNTKPVHNDKVWKLRPFMDKVKSKMLQHYQPEREMNYDESMIKYYGRHSCKQFIRGKPIRFGYKMWCLNTTSGYLVNCELYQGKSVKREEAYEKHFGKAAAPFVTMLDELESLKEYKPYGLYFDNFFTSMNLLEHLKNKGYSGTGTIRDNRIPKNCPLSSKTNLQKKKTRGWFESAIEKNTGVMFARWVDNSIVTVASTCHGVNPIATVKRYSQADKKIVQVPRPFAIGQYNSNMGGTDLMDENLARYQISIRSKKWWWPIFIWYIDVMINNAWQLHKKAGGKLNQLMFRREIATTYLKSYGIASNVGGRPSTSKSSLSMNRVSDNLRYDSTNHLVVEVPDKKRRRCAGEGCSSSVRTMCKKCSVGLCIPCFFIFHTK